MTHPILLILLLALTSASPAVEDSFADIDRQHRLGNSDLGALKSQSRSLKERMESRPTADLAWRQARNQFALGNLSRGEEKKNHFELCIQSADRTLDLDPQSAIGYFFRGLCRGKQGESQGIWSSLKIIKPFKKDMYAAIEFDPSVEAGGPHRALGKLYMELPGLLGGSMEKSIAHFKEARRLGPQMADNHLFLAEAYYQDHQFLPARDVLQTFLNNTQEDANQPEVKKIRERAEKLLQKIASYIQ